ncbi:hypothetical protein ACU4GD_26110 [Cupriavidus basilensis]
MLALGAELIASKTVIGAVARVHGHASPCVPLPGHRPLSPR